MLRAQSKLMKSETDIDDAEAGKENSLEYEREFDFDNIVVKAKATCNAKSEADEVGAFHYQTDEEH